MNRTMEEAETLRGVNVSDKSPRTSHAGTAEDFYRRPSPDLTTYSPYVAAMFVVYSTLFTI